MSSRASQVSNDAMQQLDVALALNLNELKKSGNLDQYISENQENVINNIYADKEENIAKTLGDLDRAVDTQKNTYYYYQRNHDLLKLGQDPINRMRNDVNSLIHDRDLAQRQYEINQWSSGNREDTLFVYQVIFISVLFLALLTSMWRMGIVGTALISFVTFWLIVIVLMTIVNRGHYTEFLRNKRYWNKKDFPRYSGPPIPTPDCPTAVNSFKKLYESTEKTITDFPNTFTGTIGNIAGTVASGARSVQRNMNQLKVPQ